MHGLVAILIAALAPPAAAPAAARPHPPDRAVASCPARAGWASPSLGRSGEAILAPGEGSGRIRNRVDVAADGSYSWNGAALDAGLLGRYLDITRLMRPEPVLVLNRAPGADCAALAEAAALIERHADCHPNLCLLTAGAPSAWPPPPAPPLPRP